MKEKTVTEFKLRPAPGYRPPLSNAAIVAVALVMLGVTNWAVTFALAPQLPVAALIALLVGCNGAAVWAVFVMLPRLGPGVEVTIRLSPKSVEYSIGGRKKVRCDRSKLRVKRLRGVPGAAADAPIELSGPGLPPLGIYRPGVWSPEMTDRNDRPISSAPPFELDEPEWSELLTALGSKR